MYKWPYQIEVEIFGRMQCTVTHKSALALDVKSTLMNEEILALKVQTKIFFAVDTARLLDQ